MPVTHFASNVYLSSFEDLKNKYTADPTSLEAWQKDKKEYDDINVMLRELCEFHEVINKRFKVENSRPSLRKYICARRDCSFFVSLAHTPQGTWRVKKCSSHSCEGPAPTQPRVEGGRGRPSKGDVFTAYTREFLGGALKTAALHAREAVSTRVAKELLTKICRASPSNEYLRCLVHEVRADMEGNLDALKSEIWLMSLQREWGEENVRLHHEGKEAVEAVMSGHVAREEEASKKGTESSVAESVIQGELPEEVPEKVADVMKPSIEPTKLDVLYPEHYEKVGETRGNEESVVMPSSAGMPGSVGLPSVAIPILAPTMSHPMEVPTPAAMNTPSMLHPGAPSILLAGAPAAAPVSAMSQSDVESSTIITTTAAVSSAVSSEQGEGMVSAPSGAGGEEGSENTSVQVEGASGEGPTAMTLADGEVEGNGEMKRDDQYMSSQLPLVPSSDVEEKPEEKPEQSMLAPPKSDQEESASQRPEHEVSVPPKPDQEESGQQRTEHVVSVPPQPEQQQLHVQDGQGGGESHSALPAQPAPAEIPEAPKLSSKLDVMKSNLERLRYNTYYTGVSVILPPVRKLLDLDLLGTCFCVESQDSHYKENGCFYSFAGYDASGKVMPIAFAWYWKKDDDYNWSLFFSHIRDYLGRKLDMPPHIVVGTSECRAAFFNHFKSLRFFHSIPERQEEVRKAVGSRDASTFMEMATTMNEALYHEKKTELSKAGRNFIFGESAEFAKERNLPRDREQFAVFALSLSGLTTTKAASVFGNVVNSDKHGNAAEALYRICMHIQKEYNDTKDHIDEKMREV
uniref:Uncharacterized protein n=1 Tax=Palpitomonas bilix TaxID=652834 RepID=A0A7S3D260_9EUKA|mmetsp:Transcript_19038/g.48692  ORF Transcript_19038/g.48692 Transcript_19038/m.48692 type:complete len:800 (+) Transcript_19038:97-2496(+)|eukprot:CAMPEP_0113874256 /NCGR_PEP_ID=MMETSP0780_2-20120614/4227_1 /TAXON_ID=652834 /ORGANISM="Palpitomonas bilix" /LENGTH=799 /DNA_ID=CAMNT_0000859997 /DNA_START=25 /DNA_END=2424 /DNA_ORIENTATION=+ /assembly_acc=CAM_ASM_000599